MVRGASERLSPILMTALATALALVPLIIYGDQPGQEIEYPMAIVILGGLATSTLLNLFVLPSLYLLVAGWRRSTPPAPPTRVLETVGQGSIIPNGFVAPRFPVPLLVLAAPR